MELRKSTIKNTIELIQSNKLFLPPIQRDFVWDKKRMLYIFDSIFRGYPINNFIFWKLFAETATKYPLHYFLNNYSEKIYIKHKPAPNHLLQKEVFSVIDGQQRLNSLYIGLSGTYRYKVGKKRNVEANLIPAKLYFNLMTVANLKTEDNLFNYWSEEDAKDYIPSDVPFEVGKILKWEDVEKEVNNAYESTLSELEKINKKTVLSKFIEREVTVKQHLRRLHQMLNEESLHIMEIDEQDLDKVVDIFIRINSGGLILKKSALLFSTLVSSWMEAEEEINNAVELLVNSKLDIDRDFLMTTCVVLSDLPAKLRTESFNKKNTDKIKQNWPAIKDALNKLLDILDKIGFNYQQGLSENALIPIVYYIMKGGNIRSMKALDNLKLYYVVSQINGVFGGQGDQVLEKVRSEIQRQLELSDTLNFHALSAIRLPGLKSFALNSDRLKELISETSYYNRAHSYLILSLLYKNLDLKARMNELDHIHPRSKFKKSILAFNGIKDEDIQQEWINEKKDVLSNLQLLDPKDNNNKKSKTILDYLETKGRGAARRDFLKDNFLPPWSEKWMLELKNFDYFIEWREKQLYKRLKTIFKIKN